MLKSPLNRLFFLPSFYLVARGWVFISWHTTFLPPPPRIYTYSIIWSIWLQPHPPTHLIFAFLKPFLTQRIQQELFRFAFSFPSLHSVSKEPFLGTVNKKYFSPSQTFSPVRRPFTTQSVDTNPKGYIELCRVLSHFCESVKDPREREAQSKYRRMGRHFPRLRRLRARRNFQQKNSLVQRNRVWVDHSPHFKKFEWCMPFSINRKERVWTWAKELRLDN